MRLSIIILTWNQRRITMDCLASLGALTSNDQVEVIVVDNASTDGTAEAIAESYPHIIVLRNAENRGVAAARNQGLRLARGARVLLLDNDTIASEHAVETMMTYMDSHPQVGIVACRLVDADGTVQDSAKPYPGLGVKARNVLGIKQPKVTFPADDDGALAPTYVIGACQLIRHEVIDQIGLLDEKIFYGPEDADYCLRAVHVGWQVRYLPQVTIIHMFQRVTTHSVLSPLGRKHARALFHFWRKHRQLW